MDVSIIIVNYNTKELIHNCLASIYEQTKDISFEVIISDNGSTDGSVEMVKNEFPYVKLVANNENIGFGAANNRALKIANGKYIFYLNSDTVLLNNAVKIFFDYWENTEEKEKIGALGTNLIDADGKIIHSWGMFPTCYTLCKSLLYKSLSMPISYIFNIFNI
jgi:GT2 family glycosyltransferase